MATGRHELSLALGGFLLRHLDRGDVDSIVDAAWGCVGGDVDAALRNVEDTAGKLTGSGKSVTGGGKLEGLVPGMAATISRYWGWESAGRADGNLADRLANMGLEDAEELFRDQFEQHHALVEGVPLSLDSKVYPWLTCLLWEAEGKTANREALGSAVGTLAALAFNKPERELHIRAAHHEGAIYYQLGPRRVVKIDATGWSLDPNPPMLFRKIRNLKDLPDPQRGGNFDKLLGLMNLKSDKDKRLVVAWLALSLHPDIPRPGLLALGTQGSAKSTMQRMLKRAVDPTEPEDVDATRRDIFQKANNTHVLFIDNAGTIKEDLSNTLCKIVTGGSDSKRKLYTDADDVVLKVKRAILINGINTPTDRPDLLDRIVPVELERVPKAKRRPESEMWAEFAGMHPELLGATFDAMSAALSLRAPLKETLRLADWGELAAAVYKHMGWGAERFLNDWSVVEEHQNAATYDASPLAQAVIKFMADKTKHSESAKDTLDKLEKVAIGLGLNPEKDKTWPRASNWLWKRLKELLPLLESYEIRTYQDHEGTGKDKKRVIVLERMSVPREPDPAPHPELFCDQPTYEQHRAHPQQPRKPRPEDVHQPCVRALLSATSPKSFSPRRHEARLAASKISGETTPIGEPPIS